MKTIDKKKKSAKKLKSKTKVQKTMHEFKKGSLHSGSKTGPVVKNRTQAIAIALSQAKKSTGDKMVDAYKKGKNW